MTTTIEKETIFYFDPEQLHPDPANPRKTLRELEELAASIRVHGVLEPLTVRERTEDDGGWWIVNGHRRHAAAVLADQGTVPCRVIDSGSSERDRATWRMIENLQRDDLTPTERAQGFQQLLDLGMDEDEISTSTGLSTGEVKQAAVLARSKVALTVAEKYDLTLDQALAIAEFDGDKAAVKQLTNTAQEDPGSWAHDLSRLRQERDDREAVAYAAAQAKTDGWTVLKDRPKWTTPALRVDQLAVKPGGVALTPEGHKECPDAAVHIYASWDGKIVHEHYCLNPKKNKHPERSYSSSASGGRSVAVSDKEREKKLAERRKVVAGNKAARAAEPVRRAFVVELLKRKTLPPNTARFAIDFVLTRYMRVEGNKVMFRMLAGVDAKGFLKSLPDTRVALGLVAHVAAEIEGTWAPDAWKSSYNDERKAYLTYLVGAGYKPAPIEEVVMGKVKAEAVIDVAKKVPAKKATPAKKAAARR